PAAAILAGYTCLDKDAQAMPRQAPPARLPLLEANMLVGELVAIHVRSSRLSLTAYLYRSGHPGIAVTENAWPGPHSSKVLKPFLSSISATPQRQLIPARYAMYVSPGKSQERSIYIEKAPGGTQGNTDQKE